MTFGLIKWFDTEKGFGVIVSTKNNEEIFLHISNWKDTIDISSKNKIFLEFKIGFQHNKITAIQCRYFFYKNIDSWKALFELSDEEVNLKVKYKSYNLFELAFENIPENFDFNTIADLIADRFKLNEENISSNNIFYTIINNISNKQAKDYLLNHFKNQISVYNSNTQLDFWKKGLIKDFVPEKNILLKNYNNINSGLLNKIQKIEIRNLIILKQVNQLDIDFNYEKFLDFEKILKILEPEKFKNKILSDLEKIAEKHYKKIYFNLLKETLVLNDDIYKIKESLRNRPYFLSLYIEKNWKNEIRETITKYAKIEIIIKLWQEKIIEDIDKEIIDNLRNISLHNYQLFINSDRILNETKLKIIEYNFENGNYNFVLNICERLYPNLFKEYDHKIFQKAEPSKYFQLWKDNIGKIIPIDFLNIYLNEEKHKYSEIDFWISNKQIALEQINELLLKKINNNTEIKNRKDFYTVYYSLQKYLELNKNNFEKIEVSNSEFIRLLLWHFRLIDDFDFKLLKRKYIYFNPEDQVYIFKRLFYLKHKKKLDFTLEELDEILRADLDLFLINEEFSNDFVLDISTHILIEAIKSFIKTGSFLFESDLILKDLQRNSKRKFKIENYFDKCEGRMTAYWNWDTKGKVKQITYPNNPNKFYYAIEFPAAFKIISTNYYGDNYTYYEKNPNFEYLKNEVKKLPGRKWNKEQKHWGVPAKYEKEVLEFAKKNRFFIKLNDNKHYDNNIHLVVYSRNDENGEKNIPLGIKFCEGRKAKIPHKKFKREFWWCVNQECFQNSIINHLTKEFEEEVKQNIEDNRQIWEYYTFLDFLNILEINTDEVNHMGDFIPNGHYYKFIGHINAFNRLLDKLYCEECGELLYPTQTSHFALYRDTRFHCENKNCSKYKKTIYLNHCLNGECNNIIDSRVSKKCENGLYICNSCGTCCSTEMFKKRLENLEKTGAYIHPALIKNVKLEKGHLEKAEYYCYKCGGMMTEITNTLYKCNKCGTEYNLNKFKWIYKKWTKKYARREDYPQINKNNNDDEIKL